MKAASIAKRMPFWLTLVLLLAAIHLTIAQEFQVTTPGFFYSIEGQQGQNPPLTLTRGKTYTFSIDAESNHPFQIVSDPETGASYDSGVANNNISQGTLTFSVPNDAPDTLYYICSTHFFGGTIHIVNGEPPPDFAVTTPGFFYSINGKDNNPMLTLVRGKTYTFSVDAESDHPFEIVTDPNTGTPYNSGVTNNNISQGTLTFAVPNDAPDTLYYICSLHFFGGTINIIDPPPGGTPLVQLLSIALTESDVTLRSTGTNGWKVIPEFSSNLTTLFWAPVPSFTNSYANGTNTTRFNRLEAICGPSVFLRMRNSTNQ